MMRNVYLIAYDIQEQLYDYSALKATLMSYGDVQHPMESVWFVCVPDSVSAHDIKDALQGLLQSRHDHIFVTQIVNGVPHAGWMQKAMWRWLKKNVNPET